ncbi:class I SAM-dependent methyltransferase [Eisenibacter elegans]|jgi:S-adenosylmethionine-diacylgycerolhomoserine-N-methlytransferase|uniref:class I SAM-dependent methyltransferase n=1 Tax=Eisenibacter elegans TaxID=997 RepID=UPI000415C27D|nr:class I SAM-dependent methyltransferase [Eisenibacter elegans]
MKDRLSQDKEAQLADMRNYYKFQAKIYDLTRWVFLFGRKSILKHIPFEREAQLQILDVGCGTGINSYNLAKRFPKAQITSLDVSEDMIERATQKLRPFADRVQCLHQPYESGTQYNNHFDIILFSYSLTMINPQWSELIDQARLDLKPGGVIVVSDFHDTPVGLYKRFMRANHVRLDGHLVPYLQQRFEPVYTKIKKGYLGVWQYMMFIGRKA